MKRLVMYKTTSNAHIIGIKSFWKNLFSRKFIHINNPYFVDFVWTDGQVEKVYLNTLRLIYANNTCSLNTRHVLFQVEPNADLVGMYNSLTDTVKQAKEDIL